MEYQRIAKLALRTNQELPMSTKCIAGMALIPGKLSRWFAVHSLAQVILALSLFPSYALNCKPLEPKGGANVDVSIQGKLAGKIDGIFARIAGGQRRY